MSIIDTRVGTRIRVYRATYNLSQTELAKMTALNQSIVSDLERGEKAALEKLQSTPKRFQSLMDLINVEIKV